jgi:O-succinylbenzoic acid--CoA ligase
MSRSEEDVIRLLGLFWLGAIPVLGGPEPGSILTDEKGEGIPAFQWTGDQTQLLLFTSGSTGTPQAVPLSAGQIQASVQASAEHLGSVLDDAWLCPLPLHHIGGLSILFRCLASATTLVLAPGPFDAQRISQACQSGEITQLSLVPTQLERMLPSLQAAPLSPRLRFVLLGGSSAHRDLLDACERLNLPVARTWGMTECASQIATARPSVLRGPLPLLPGVRVRRDEPTGRLLVEGPIAPDGAFLTRDLGSVGPEGVLVEGRVDDLVISGGENLSLSRITEALLGHPEVLDAVVLARPDPTWGERPHAILVSRDVARPSLLELRDYLLERGLRKREVPDVIQWVECLPRNEMGKLLKGELSLS